MELIAIFFLVVIGVVIWYGVSALISHFLAKPTGSKATWWIFFFGLIGAIIYLLNENLKIHSTNCNHEKID